ncbi:hypothetical protein OH146_04140 [Salinibacterium sp. SYSU T00001]|uniref:hypothetical protein n=1 Tax=Homoserinimonas sedimenticola TaxID=2986805 RepID=UPI0022362315|nr:hypothetical protein [Salinibacterium sedimenticola]MCW4384960.1 hypothetical protein [Salinibacterium sedimenticola]
MRKFLFSGSVISALFGGVSVIKHTKDGPYDWRLILIWVHWLAAVGIAVGTVIQNEKSRELEH